MRVSNTRKNNMVVFISCRTLVDHRTRSSKKVMKTIPVDASHFNTENIIISLIENKRSITVLRKKMHQVHKIFWLIKNYPEIDFCFNAHWLESFRKYIFCAFFYFSKWHADIFWRLKIMQYLWAILYTK